MFCEELADGKEVVYVGNGKLITAVKYENCKIIDIESITEIAVSATLVSVETKDNKCHTIASENPKALYQKLLLAVGGEELE